MIDREIAIAKGIGLNVVRTWLRYHAYLENRQLQLANIETFLQICEKNGVKAILALFNNDGIEWDLRSPGPDKLGTDYYPEYDVYIKDILSRHIADKRVAMWESMNEPFVGPILLWLDKVTAGVLGSAYKLTGMEAVYSLVLEQMPQVIQFLRHCYVYMKSIDPDTPITIGSGDYRDIFYLAECQDVISFHTYEAEAEKFQAIVQKAKKCADEAGKPIILSEWGSSVYSSPIAATTGEQLAYYQRIMPLLQEAGIGWCIWSLVVGVEPYAFHSLVNMNGVERPAVAYIRKRLLNS